MLKRGVSIVIPTLNEQVKIGLLLDHLASLHSFDSLEVIVVDSSDSADNIASLVKSYGALYMKSVKGGRGAQLSQGAEHAQGDVLCFLHADVLPAAGFVESLLAALDEGIDFGYFSYRFDKPSLLLKFNAWWTQFKGFFTGGGDQLLFIKREVYFQSGGYNTEQEFMEDFEFHRRLVEQGYKFSIIHKPSTVSARKYEHHSYWKVNYMNITTLFNFKRGKEPSKLKERYQRALK